MTVPLVLLHGFTGSSATWGEDALARLGGPARTVVAVDLPGHGTKSWGDDPAAYTLERALVEVSSATSGPFDLAGYSMGGRVALHFAHRFPGRVRRLVLESASPGLESETERTERRAADETLARRIEDQGIPSFVAEWERSPVLLPSGGRSASEQRRATAIRLANRAEGLAGALRGLGTGALPSLWAELPYIGTPTLLLVGERDTKFVAVARRMAAEMPDATVEVVARAGHTVHLDDPAAWTDAVERHLAGPE